jgi:hypothetical protein
MAMGLEILLLYSILIIVYYLTEVVLFGRSFKWRKYNFLVLDVTVAVMNGCRERRNRNQWCVRGAKARIGIDRAEILGRPQMQNLPVIKIEKTKVNGFNTKYRIIIKMKVRLRE